MTLQCHIDWSRRFARKTVLYFTGLKNRVEGMEAELARVGLSDVERQWQYPSPFDKVLLRNVKHIPCFDGNPRGMGYFNSSMGHYRAIATAFHLGCESVLVMEDDIRFLKDVGRVAEIVGALPDDFDVALLDSFFMTRDPKGVNAEVITRWRNERKVNEHWAEFDSLYSLGCYALSRRGMERMMFAFEAVQTAPKIGMIRIADHFLKRGILGAQMQLYFARQNVAIQREMGAANSPPSDIRKKYEEMGFDLADYADA
jgi:hypothetical protein